MTKTIKPRTNTLWLASKFPNVFFGYLVLVCGILGQICGGPGQSPMIGAFVNVMMESLSLTRTEISFIFFLAATGAALLQPLYGSFVDRVGVCISGICSIVFLTISCYIVSYAYDRNSLLLGYFFIRFFGTGAVVISCQKAINLWFVAKRGRFSGFGGAICSLVAVGVIPPLSHHLIDEIGWRSTYIAAGNVILLVTPFMAFFFREAPEVYGLLPDGEKPKSPVEPEAHSQKHISTSSSQRLSLGDNTTEVELASVFKPKSSLLPPNTISSDCPTPAEPNVNLGSNLDNSNSLSSISSSTTSTTATTTTDTTQSQDETTNIVPPVIPAVSSSSSKALLFVDKPSDEVDPNHVDRYEEFVWTRSMALKTSAFWSITTGVHMLYAIGSSIFFWMVQVLEEAHLDPASLSGFYFTLAVAQMIFGIIIGFLIDRISPHHILAVALVLQCVNLLILSLEMNIYTAPFVAFLQGVVNSMANNVISIVCAQYYGRSHLGAISGMALSIAVVGTAVGPLPVGLISDALGGFQIAFLMMGVFPLLWIVVVLACGAKPKHKGLNFADPV